MDKIVYKEDSYRIIGICMDVHRELGHGFLEIVYKDALEFEFRKENIKYAREVEYTVLYKDVLLPHKFYADFVVYDKIIFEVKGVSGIADEHIAQTLNYLKASGNKLGLLVNFGESSLKYKRILL